MTVSLVKDLKTPLKIISIPQNRFYHKINVKIFVNIRKNTMDDHNILKFKLPKTKNQLKKILEKTLTKIKLLLYIH